MLKLFGESSGFGGNENLMSWQWLHEPYGRFLSSPPGSAEDLWLW